MRVLVLTNMFPPHAYGGYELWCRDVARRWAKAGHEVLVLTSDLRLPGPDLEEEPGIEVRRQLRLYWRDQVIFAPNPLQRLAWELHNQRRLRAAVAAFRPDVCSAWAMGAMSFGLLRWAEEHGIPVVSVVCDEWPVYGPDVDAWSRLFAQRPRLERLTRLASGLPCRLPDLDVVGPACFISDAMQKKAKTLSRWSFPDSDVVPAGIEWSELTADNTTEDREWSWRILHVGRVDPRKGLDTVVRAVAMCPEQTTLQMLGSGDARYLAELRALADELGVAARIDFGDSHAASQPLRAQADGTRKLAGIYRAADAVVFAPLWDEPFGLVPLEAMACGTPVAASPTGGSVEFLVDGKNCLTFTSGEPESLTAALERLSADRSLRRAIVAGGLETAARYDADSLASVLEQWHRRSGQAGAPPAGDNAG